MAVPSMHVLAAKQPTSGAFDPLNITGLWGWWDASDAGSFTYAGLPDQISQWDDLSGNARHQVLVAGAGGPFRNGTQNSLDTITYATSQAMKVVSTLAHAYVSVFAVMNMSSSAVTNARLITLSKPTSNDYDNATRGIAILRNGSADQVAGYSNAAMAVKAITTNAYHTVSSIFNGTDHRLYVDGSAGTTVAHAATFDVTELLVGCGYYSSTYAAGWYGNVAELIVADAAIGSTEQAAIEAYLKAKWGTP